MAVGTALEMTQPHIAKAIGMTQGRVSQLLKDVREKNAKVGLVGLFAGIDVEDDPFPEFVANETDPGDYQQEVLAYKSRHPEAPVADLIRLIEVIAKTKNLVKDQ